MTESFFLSKQSWSTVMYATENEKGRRMDSRSLAEGVAAALKAKGHYVQVTDGTTPILISTISGQEVVAFCFHSVFEVCERPEACTILYGRESEPSQEQAVELMLAAAADMMAKRREAMTNPPAATM